MPNVSKPASTTLPPETSGSPPVWRGISPRLSLFAAIGCCAVVLLTAVLLGERDAARAVAETEWSIGNDLAASVDRILDRVSSTRRAELTALVGRPCGDILPSLATLHTYMRNVRGVAVVAEDRVYCSSGHGALDLPLSVYVPSSAPGTRINLLPQTLFHPDEPVLALFDGTGNGAGILYVISGEHIADLLSRGLRHGAQHIALSIAGIGSLTDNGNFVPLPKSPPTYSTRVTSGRWPFSIALTSSAEFASRLRWSYRLAFGAVGVLLDILIAVTYLLAFAPRRLLLRAVHRGLRRNEFHVVYQPIVDIASREPAGAEALLRWDHPAKGAISPSLFMGAVESSSLLAEVTRFVLRTAVAEVNRYAPTFPRRVAVNIASRDLERKGFAAEVLALSRRLPEGVSLVLELTERLLLSESASTAAIFRTLKAEGIKLAIDDFGTHHSNLDLLSRFPFDYVKIDRQFVSQVDTGHAELIKGIVSVAKHFGLQVIAEGVETEAQHRVLQAVGVPFGQGYLYQRPVRVEQLATALPIYR